MVLLQNQVQELIERETILMADKKGLEEDLTLLKAQLKEYTEMKSASPEERAARGPIVAMLKGRIKELETKLSKYESETETETETESSGDEASRKNLRTKKRQLSTVKEDSEETESDETESSEDDSALPESPVKVVVTQPTIDQRSTSPSVHSEKDSVSEAEEKDEDKSKDAAPRAEKAEAPTEKKSEPVHQKSVKPEPVVAEKIEVRFLWDIIMMTSQNCYDCNLCLAFQPVAASPEMTQKPESDELAKLKAERDDLQLKLNSLNKQMDDLQAETEELRKLKVELAALQSQQNALQVC